MTNMSDCYISKSELSKNMHLGCGHKASQQHNIPQYMEHLLWSKGRWRQCHRAWGEDAWTWSCAWSWLFRNALILRRGHQLRLHLHGCVIGPHNNRTMYTMQLKHPKLPYRKEFIQSCLIRVHRASSSNHTSQMF